MISGASAAGQLSEVLTELQSLPRNGQLRALGAAGPKPLHRSSSGTPLQAQPLQVGRCPPVHICLLWYSSPPVMIHLIVPAASRWHDAASGKSLNLLLVLTSGGSR